MSALPQVDFYLLEAADRHGRLVYACRLAEKAYELGHRIFVRTGGPAETAEFDDLLWKYPDDSFVPHGTWPAEPDFVTATPVLIGRSDAPASHRDVLINLAFDAPADFSAYARVCEIVGGDEEARQAGRDRWRLYKDAGCSAAAHHVQTAAHR
jgi:DNA polymerase-3 subunit chi